MFLPPPPYMSQSWRLHLGPPPPRRPPVIARPPMPRVVATPRMRHHVLDWRLRVSAAVALLLAVIAMGAG